MNVVVDTNVLAYYWLPGARSDSAIALRRATDDWLAPRLWRSEFRSVLSGYMRTGRLDLPQAKAVMRACEAQLVHLERDVDSIVVLELVERSNCSAYDCEFVALAVATGLQLVTEDKQILRDFPRLAVNMTDVVG